VSQADKRAWHWGLIIAVAIFCVVVPWVRNQNIQKSLDKQLAAGQITEEEAKAPFIKLGLDLAGGVDLLYQASPPPGSPAVTQQQMDGLVETIRRRIDPEGIKEPLVQQIGNDRLNIQIPGETDPERTKILIGQTALLQFVNAGDERWNEGDKVVFLAEGEKPPEVKPEDSTTPAADGSTTPPAEDQTGDKTATENADGETTDETAPVKETRYVTLDKVILEGSMLKQASLGLGDYGGYRVDIAFDREGSRLFAEHTARNVGRYLAIALDGQIISCPVINSAIPHGRGYISGNFTSTQARDLSTLLTSGSLQVPLEILQSRAIGPTLGAESVDLSIRAGIIGLICVMLFMLLLYRFVGLMADIALMYYAFIFLGLLSAFGVTLTLPGIAGFILSLGMAVDANVLIFERLKEELNAGKTYKAAIEAGFDKAWPAIMDSNVTTLITGIVLYMMGSGTIKGFAVTLNMGILISMFSAMIVTRVIIYVWSGIPALQKPFLFGMGVHVTKKAS
jgi:preprotein translocase subunit SecD